MEPHRGMTDNNEDTPRFAADQLDENTRREWLLLSARTHAATIGVRPSRVNEELSAAVYSEPESPVAPAYLLWIAENLTREARYPEAVEAFDPVIERAQSVESFIPGVDFALAALHHKAEAA